MAQAYKVTVPCEFRVQLVLSSDEAQFLHDLLKKVGGNPTESRRKHADAMRAALIDAKAAKDVFAEGAHDFSPSTTIMMQGGPQRWA